MLKRIHETFRSIWALTVVLTLLLSAVPAIAAEGSGAADMVQIDQSGAVTLISTHIASEGICSVQLALQVPADENVSFTFANNMDDKLTYSIFNDGVLTVYIAGVTPLMSAGQTTLRLGTLSGISDLTAVALSANKPLQYVYGSAVISQAVELTVVEMDGTVPDTTPPPEASTAPTMNPSASDEMEDARAQLRDLLASTAEMYGSQDAAGLYSAESWGALLTALDHANTVLQNPDATQSELEEAIKLVSSALNGLIRAGRSALVKAMQEARNFSAEAYTAESFAALQDAIRNAEEVLLDDGADDAEWSAAEAALQAAVEALVPVAAPDGSGPTYGDGPDSGQNDVPGTTAAPSDPVQPTTPAEATFVPRPTPVPSASELKTATPAPTSSPAPSAASGNGTHTPRTGDDTLILPYFLALCLSVGLLVFVLKRRKQ